MAFPEPVPGLVIRYSYLWYREHLEGRDESQKELPCAIIAALRNDAHGKLRVLVLPVTHTPPEQVNVAIEIPAKVKARLGLDDARSWIVLSEWNEFLWPGQDLRQIPGSSEASVVYGMLPPRLFVKIREEFLSILTSARRVRRT